MDGVLRLGAGDVERLCLLRAAALRAEPWAFGSAPGDDRLEDRDATAAMLGDASQAVFAVEVESGGDLVAMAGVQRSVRVKHAHLASVWGVYVDEACRGRGYGRGVVSACVAEARRWAGVERVGLSVSTRTVAARRLYESMGFEAWGVEPGCTRIGDEVADEVHMSLVLRRCCASDARDGAG